MAGATYDIVKYMYFELRVGIVSRFYGELLLLVIKSDTFDDCIELDPGRFTKPIIARMEAAKSAFWKCSNEKSNKRWPKYIKAKISIEVRRASHTQ